jgi:hypothetical protein
MVEPGTPPVVTIDGAVAPIPNLRVLAAGTVDAQSGAVRIAWNDGHTVQVTNHGDYLDAELAASLASTGWAGLLGNASGSLDDDLQLPNGTVLAQPVGLSLLYGEFADGWRVTQAGSLFQYAPGTGASSFTDRSFPDSAASVSQLPAATFDAAKAACLAGGVNPGPALENCILDVGHTGEMTFVAAAAATPPPLATCVPDCTGKPCGGGDGCGGLCPSACPSSNGCAPMPLKVAGAWSGDGTTIDGQGGHNATLVGTAAYTSGLRGQAFSYPDATAQIVVPYDPALDATQAVTLEAWVRPDPGGNCGGAWGDYCQVLAKEPDDNSVFPYPPGHGRNYYLGYYNSGGGTLVVDASYTNGQVNYPVGGGTIVPGQWSHIATVIDPLGSGMIAVYINGIKTAETPAPVPLESSLNSLKIGGGGTASRLGFIGAIDEPAVYMRALSPQQIFGIYSAGPAGKCPR